MKAFVYNKKSLPEKLVLQEIEKPVPDDNEVLIKICAVSLNAADYRSLQMGMIPKRKIFGADVAGIVESVGKNANNFKPGDEVFGDLAGYGFGGFAEYVAVPEKALAHKPAMLSFEETAAMPMASLTALQALRDKGQLKSGQKVLIVGSGGGVGTFAVQLARYFGAEVTAVCGPRNAEKSIELGAKTVIDYTREDFSKSDSRYDLILAVNGNYPLMVYKRILNPDGKCIVIGGALPQILKSLMFGKLLSLGSKKFITMVAKANSSDLEYLASLATDGHIRPVIARIFPFEQTVEAMQQLREGHATGKLVISMKA